MHEQIKKKANSSFLVSVSYRKILNDTPWFWSLTKTNHYKINDRLKQKPQNKTFQTKWGLPCMKEGWISTGQTLVARTSGPQTLPYNKEGHLSWVVSAGKLFCV